MESGLRTIVRLVVIVTCLIVLWFADPEPFIVNLTVPTRDVVVIPSVPPTVPARGNPQQSEGP